MSLLAAPFVCLFGLALSGCAGYSPQPHLIGQTRSEVIASLGAPDPTPADLNQASRLDFPRGPMGKHTYSVAFDMNGRAISYDQLLTEARFKRILPGMSASQVVDVIGVSRDRFEIARGRGYVWNYRFETPRCEWFQVEFTASDFVRSAGIAMQPSCRMRRLP